MEISDYVTRRNAALLALDKSAIVELMAEAGVLAVPADEKIFWAGVHKARLVITSMPLEVKEESRAWLIDNGFVAE